MSYDEIRAEVLAVALDLTRHNLTVGSSGNVSARIDEQESTRALFAITPHSRYYEQLSVEDILVVDEEGEPVAGEGIPSIELPLHVAVYSARPDVGAVIHAHPPLASAVSVLGRPIPPIIEDQVLFLGGQIEVAPQHLSGSDELARGVINALGERNACLLANHGAVAVGRDVREAMHACRYLEKLAQIYLAVLAVGDFNVLPPDVVETLTAFYRMKR